jgi:hypothetical protein
MIYKTEEQSQMIKDCIKRNTKLTEWEFNFVEKLDKKSILSQKEVVVLDKIWDAVT